jgi:hypothetical protein
MSFRLYTSFDCVFSISRNYFKNFFSALLRVNCKPSFYFILSNVQVFTLGLYCNTVAVATDSELDDREVGVLAQRVLGIVASPHRPHQL